MGETRFEVERSKDKRSTTRNNMADPALQALLDPDGLGTGIMITRRVDNGGTLASYYVVPDVNKYGRARWVDVTAADTDANKNTAIRAALESR